ncbi:SufD family Fe-S cluster assembly protein [Candidatus Micrarchaeota archaeon]|nr:SufD family Fe-S cluster assembly protein [Candidatus Micrarchaeota archaeon]
MKKISVSDSKDVLVSSDSSITISDALAVKLIIRPLGECKVDLKIGTGCDVCVYIIADRAASLLLNNYVGEGSTLHSYGLWLSSGSSEVLSHLVGEKSQAYELDLFGQMGTSKLQLNSVLRHANHSTKGNILVRGVAKDSASVTLDGMIKIEKNGSGADSFLTQNVMLLNPGAHATANPELEIENNDVSSRHSASVSQIDEDKIFYLMSRGVSREDSRKLIVEGFLEATIQKIPDFDLSKEISQKCLTIL